MNANFKTRVFGGFDREDVISFIEKTSLEHQKRVSALEEENKRLSDRCGAAEAEVQALRELPCRLTIEYTPCDGALIFRDYSLAVRREIIRTVKDVCRERGHELTVLLDETQE